MFIIILLNLSLNSFSQEVTWKDNELTFAPQPISRFIAKNLPEKWISAQKVGGLYFKLHPFFFCRREPKGDVFCHLYLNQAKGTLQRMDFDANYGQGSIENYIEDNKVALKQRSSRASVILKNNILYVQFKGALARRLTSRFFPEYEQLIEWKNQMYMKYQGDLVQCYHPVNQPRKAECRIAVPIKPSSPQKNQKKQSQQLS